MSRKKISAGTACPFQKSTRDVEVRGGFREKTEGKGQGRFPRDFMFQLTEEEYSNVKSQIVISRWGGLRRAKPYAFTEQGVAVLSGVV